MGKYGKIIMSKILHRRYGLIDEGYVEKNKFGYYQWQDERAFLFIISKHDKFTMEEIITMKKEVLGFNTINDISELSAKKIEVSWFLSLLVFVIHISTFNNYENIPFLVDKFVFFVQRVIPIVAVPLYFIISGAFFYRDYTNDKYLKKLKSRMKSLFIPYIFWNCVWMLFNIFATMYFSKFFIGREIFEFNSNNIIQGIFHYKYNAPFWFVFALLIFIIAAPLINLLISNKIGGIISILTVMILYHFDIGLPIPLFFSKTCIIYYLVGAYTGKHFFNLFTRIKKNTRITLASIIGILMSIVYSFITNGLETSSYQVVNVIVLIIYSFSLWNIWDLVVLKISPRKFMIHSFYVYALHINISSIITKLLWLVLPKIWPYAWLNFLLTISLTLLVIEVFVIILEKYLPFLYKILSGGR